jgi:hypothetical protein
LSAFDIIAGIASLLGLAVSVWTLREARSAKRAAQEARLAVFQGSAADDLENLTRLATDHLRSLYDGNSAEAIVRLRDLSALIPLVRHRWNRVLKTEGRVRLDEAALRLKVITRAISNEREPDVKMLIDAGHAILTAIAETNGLLRSEIDSEVDHAE